MPVDTILDNLLSNVMHLKRLNSLKVTVCGVFEAKHLSVTGRGSIFTIANSRTKWHPES